MCGQTHDIIILSKGVGHMNTYKAYKLRIYPNAEQKIMIDKTFGCTRFVFNKFLSERKEIKTGPIMAKACPIAITTPTLEWVQPLLRKAICIYGAYDDIAI